MANGEYATITYDLGASSDIKNIAVLQSKNSQYRIGHYSVYAAESSDDLYSENNLIFEDDGTAYSTMRQVASFEKDGKQLFARYVGMKVDDATLDSAENDVLRLSEFTVYTSYSGFTVDTGNLNDADSVVAASAYDKALNPLTRANSLISNVAAIGGSWSNGTDGGDYNVPSGLTAYTSGDGFDDITVNNGNVLYAGNRDSNGNLLSLRDDYNNYYQLDYLLPVDSDISKFSVYGHRNTQWSPYHMLVSFASSRDELFTDSAKNIDFYARGTYSIVSLDEAVNARWMSVRIICGIQPSFIGKSVDPVNCYARMYHIDVFGAFGTVVDGTSVTVTSDWQDAVQKGELQGATDINGNYGIGAKLTLTAKEQATKDGVNYTAFKGWYEGETLLSTKRVYTYTIADTEPHTIKAVYSDTLSYRVNFTDRLGNIIYTAYVIPDGTLTEEDIYSASSAVPEFYGRLRQLDENELQIWDRSVADPITGDCTFKALYIENEVKYTVSVTKTDGSVSKADYGFDARLELADSAAQIWTVNGNEYSTGSSVTLYVFGDMEIMAKTSSPSNAHVTIVKKSADSNSLTVMAHINNPENKVIKKAGVKFVSGTSYQKLGDAAWSDEYLTQNNCRAVEAVVNSYVGADFMATLKNVQSQKNAVRRAAQAYVVFEDGEELYSNVMYEDFAKKLSNPIIPTASGNVADPFFAVEDGVYYQAFNKGSGLYVIWSSTLEGLATAYDDGNYQLVNGADDGDVYRNFYAPEIHKMNDGYWYIYSAPEYGNGTNHKMAAVKSKTQYLKDGFNSEVTVMDYSTDAALSIDGTVMNFGGKQYFIWSEQSCMKIALMSSPTELYGTSVSFLTPKYSWEKQVYSLVEGPAMLYHGGRVFMSYSASDSQSDYYCIGLLELVGSNPLDPESWVRVGDKPVVSKTDSVFGPGHNSFLTVNENGYNVTYIVYHAHLQPTAIIGTAWKGRNVFIQRVYWDINGYPRFMKPSADIE